MTSCYSVALCVGLQHAKRENLQQHVQRWPRFFKESKTEKVPRDFPVQPTQDNLLGCIVRSDHLRDFRGAFSVYTTARSQCILWSQMRVIGAHRPYDLLCIPLMLVVSAQGGAPPISLQARSCAITGYHCCYPRAPSFVVVWWTSIQGNSNLVFVAIIFARHQHAIQTTL